MNTDGIIQSYFNRKNIIVDHQIKSYNYYVDTIIPQIIYQNFPLIIKFNDIECIIREISLDITNIRIGKPHMIENNGCSKLMTPNMARIRNSTYIAPIIVDFESSITIKEDNLIINLKKSKISNIILGKIPIMVKSNYCTTKIRKDIQNTECKYDPGCYFIVKGNENAQSIKANIRYPIKVNEISNPIIKKKSSPKYIWKN